MKRLLLPIALGFVLTAPYALYSQVIDQEQVLLSNDDSALR